MRSTFLQILLIFSSPECYQLQFSIPRAYFVYTVWHCTGQHCIHVRIICLPVCGASWWVLLQHPVTLRVFFIIECGIVCFLCTMRVLAVWHHPHPLGYLYTKFCFTASITELAHGEKLCTQSLTHSPGSYSITHSAYLMPWEPKLALRKTA